MRFHSWFQTTEIDFATVSSIQEEAYSGMITRTAAFPPIRVLIVIRNDGSEREFSGVPLSRRTAKRTIAVLTEAMSASRASP
ncbi:hypothetical protein GCM10023068_43390 [Leifsonia shinshuensis]